MVHRNWADKIEKFEGVSDRIAILQIQLKGKKILTIVRVYVPTTTSSASSAQLSFNSIPWTHILEALMNAKVLVNLCNIIPDYFQDWVVVEQTASGMVRKEMTC